MINKVSPIPSPTEIEINKGIKKTEVVKKIEAVVSKKEISKSEFKDLAKSVVGGRESLATFLKTNGIVPAADVDRLNSFHFGFDSKLKVTIGDSKALQKAADKINPNVAYSNKLDTQKAELEGSKKEVLTNISDLTAKLTTLKKGTPEYGEKLGDLHALKQQLKGINERIDKIPLSQKAGITPESIKGYQASKTGENLYQKVMGTKIYGTVHKVDDKGNPVRDANGKLETKLHVTTMLRSDNLGILPAIKPQLKAEMDAKKTLFKDDHATYGWANVKDKSVPTPDHMIDNISYRKAFVDQLMKQVKEEFQVEGNMRAVGSTNLTSDYDATILGLTSTKKGEEGKPVSPVVQAKIVAKFNEEFRKEFGVESGTAFDTNIYVDDFDLSDKNIKNPVLPADLQATDDNNQDALALVKQRIHLGGGDEWKNYTKSVIDSLPEGKKAEMAAKFSQADKYANDRDDEINKEIVSINKPGLGILNLSKEQIKQHAEDIKHAAGPKAGDIEAQALNRLYEKKLVIVKTEEAKADLPGADKQKIDVNVKKLKGEALFFANEPYFSEGGVRHIVGNLQKFAKKPFDEKFEITKAQGLQSISENIGDTMKEFNHFSKDGLGTLAYKSSKYLNRLADAITITTGSPKGEGAAKAMVIPDDLKITLSGKEYPLKDVVADLRKSNLAMLDIRGEKVGKDLSASGKAKLALKMFDENTTLEPFKAVKNPEQYKKLLLDITSQVNIKARQ